jgi:hypothetical protein
MKFETPDDTLSAVDAVEAVNAQLLASGLAEKSVEAEAAFTALRALARRIDGV